MSLVEKINNANALGRQNLTDKGVDVSADATTYEIMQSIADIIVGGGSGDIVSYTDITYNDDNTITLTDTDGTEHTMVCEYTDGKLTSLKFDGKSVALKYEGDVLVSVGGVSVEVSNAPVSASSGGTEEIEQLIDESGVLDTEGTVTEKVEQLIDKAENEKAWYNQSALWTDHFAYLFKNSTDVKRLPRLRFDNATSLRNLTDGSTIEEIDYYVDCSKATNVNYCFSNTPKLKHIVGINISNVTNGDGFFFKSAIEEIDKPLNPSKIPSYAAMITFNLCDNLRKISFVTESIKWSMTFSSAVLSAESIQSIIDGLATVTTAQTLTLNSAIILTDEQKSTINAKGWTLVQ